jgi:hypothetical protein
MLTVIPRVPHSNQRSEGRYAPAAVRVGWRTRLTALMASLSRSSASVILSLSSHHHQTKATESAACPWATTRMLQNKQDLAEQPSKPRVDAAVDVTVWPTESRVDVAVDATVRPAKSRVDAAVDVTVRPTESRVDAAVDAGCAPACGNFGLVFYARPQDAQPIWCCATRWDRR